MMATPILSQLTPQQQIATTALAKLAAKNAVRRKLKREGRVKVQLVSLSQISRLADIYLEEYPELFAEAPALALTDKHSTVKSLPLGKLVRTKSSRRRSVAQ